jgi:hypothetical protein
MRADSALSHLSDGELCIALMKDGQKHRVRWSTSDWCFYYTDSDPPAVCRFEDMKEWMLATMKFDL